MVTVRDQVTVRVSVRVTIRGEDSEAPIGPN